MSETAGVPGSDTKRCPACGEEVRAEALICRFCRYDFRTSTIPPANPYQPVYIERRTNGYAIASLVLGIVNMLVGSVLALVFGYKAIREIDESHGTQTGRGLALAGVVLGWIGLVMGVIWLILFFMVFLPNASEFRFNP
jgi:hypothetical protein